MGTSHSIYCVILSQYHSIMNNVFLLILDINVLMYYNFFLQISLNAFVLRRKRTFNNLKMQLYGSLDCVFLEQ